MFLTIVQLHGQGRARKLKLKASLAVRLVLFMCELRL